MIVLKISIQIIFEILLFILLFFNVFVFRTFNLLGVLIGTAIFFIAMLLLVKYKKPIKQRNQALYYIVGGGCLLVQIVAYICGLFTGYSTSYNVFYKGYLTKSHIIAVFMIIILVEFIRYLVLLNLSYDKKDKKCYIARFIMLINYIFIDYLIMGKNCDFGNRYMIIELLLTFLIPNITKHLFLDYTCNKYGFKVNYLYRLIMDLYLYFVPIYPNISDFLENVVLAILPYFLYLALENVLGKRKKVKIREGNEKNVKANVFAWIFLAIIVYLISCQFTYAMIAVGSESMHGAINKGDAVIYKAYDDETLEVGNVIVFKQNDRIVIHRISSIYELDNGGQAYITKGDANESEDNWIVTPSNVVGVVKLRILWIAWPSVLLNEWL